MPSDYPRQRPAPSLRKPSQVRLLTWLIALLPGQSQIQAGDFLAPVRPGLERFCGECHSHKLAEADVNLIDVNTLEQFQTQLGHWESALEMLESRQMPPAEAPQLTEEEREELLAWIRGQLLDEAARRAGDPGPSPPRRLSNAEYTYALRDLTGLEAFNPAHEFPADGAAGEGFTNAAQALSLSGPLLEKYLEAAQATAERAVLTPGGIRFSAANSKRDWTEELLASIRSLYQKYASTQGASQVNLQGVIFETNGGGRLPLQQYLQATLDAKHAGRSADDALHDVAHANGLSAKYLQLLWNKLHADYRGAEYSLLGKVQACWRQASPDDALALARGIEQLQSQLHAFHAVGQIGKVGGPAAWMTPVDKVCQAYELQYALPNAEANQTFTLSIRVHPLTPSGASTQAVVQLRQPRWVGKGTEAPTPLRFVPAQQAVADPPIHPNASALESPPANAQVASQQIELPVGALFSAEVPASALTERQFLAGVHLVNATELESFQLQVTVTPASIPPAEIEAQWTKPAAATLTWRGAGPGLNQPILAQADGMAAKSWRASLDEFRELFPAALCYLQIVPVDEVITLTLFHREDEPLQRLMLTAEEAAELNRLWDELHFVSEDALTQVDAWEQLMEYASQDADPKTFAPLKPQLDLAVAAHVQRRQSAEPMHLEAVLDFASRAFRRPLQDNEGLALRQIYAKARIEAISHPVAIQRLLVRILTSPHFLIRVEPLGINQSGADRAAESIESQGGVLSRPLDDWELASRLSFVLWSSVPDAELRAAAERKELSSAEGRRYQWERMRADPRVDRFAEQFALQWLQLHDFDQVNEKSETLFPQFAELRQPMREEVLRFVTDLVQRDGSIFELLAADHTFVNHRLAEYYELPISNPQDPLSWYRTEGMRQSGRGGVLGMSAILAKTSGAARSSAILRGQWVSEVLLGEKLPKPPKGVPTLPEVPPPNVTDRQLVEMHSSVAECAQCHRRFDPFGFALEGFDAIGRQRPTTDAELTAAVLPDGHQVQGLTGLQDYLLTVRKDAFERQFCRKLAGYALGRSLTIADETLLQSMLQELRQQQGKCSAPILVLLNSRQFTHKRVDPESTSPRQ